MWLHVEHVTSTLHSKGATARVVPSGFVLAVWRAPVKGLSTSCQICAEEDFMLEVFIPFSA